MQTMLAREQLEQGDCLSQRTLRLRHTTQLRNFGAGRDADADGGASAGTGTCDISLRMGSAKRGAPYPTTRNNGAGLCVAWWGGQRHTACGLTSGSTGHMYPHACARPMVARPSRHQWEMHVGAEKYARVRENVPSPPTTSTRVEIVSRNRERCVGLRLLSKRAQLLRFPPWLELTSSTWR